MGVLWPRLLRVKIPRSAETPRTPAAVGAPGGASSEGPARRLGATARCLLRSWRCGPRVGEAVGLRLHAPGAVSLRLEEGGLRVLRPEAGGQCRAEGVAMPVVAVALSRRGWASRAPRALAEGGPWVLHVVPGGAGEELVTRALVPKNQRCPRGLRRR